MKKPPEMNSAMEIENSNNSKFESLVLNDVQLKEVPAKPKIEEKAKPFVLIKEHESPVRENKHENANKHESYNNRHENNNNNVVNNSNNREIKQEINNNNIIANNNNNNKVEKKEILPEVKKSEIKENKQENIPKKFELIKEGNKDSSRSNNNNNNVINNNNNHDNLSQNEGKTTHLFKLNDPIELKSLAQKKSECEVDTPQGKAKPRPSNTSSNKLDKSADDTDSLVIYLIIY